MTARRYIVDGRVQGVGFRYFVAEVAADIGLSGWVRNLHQGSVEVLADGDDEQLVRLEKALWQGPPLARVQSVDAEPALPPEQRGFHVRSTAR